MHIGHVATRVPDVEASAEHASGALGLIQTEGTDTAGYLTANAKHHELQLLQGEGGGLDHIGLEVADSGELEEVKERALNAGGKLVSEGPEEPGLKEAFRVAGPSGVVFEVYTPMDVAKLEIANVIGRHARKLGHVTLLSSEGEALVRFIVDGFGFRVSDTQTFLTWMRCDIDHHGLAVGSVEVDAMHHYAFELNGWDGMRMYLDDLAVDGKTIVYGPGRHGPGFNLFTYLPEPSGALIEGYAGMLKIEDEANYEPIDWDSVPGALNLWGPDMPANFLEFGVPILGPSS